jgi:hypothetical protein
LDCNLLGQINIFVMQVPIDVELELIYLSSMAKSAGLLVAPSRSLIYMNSDHDSKTALCKLNAY